MQYNEEVDKPTILDVYNACSISFHTIHYKYNTVVGYKIMVFQIPNVSQVLNEAAYSPEHFDTFLKKIV